MDLPFARPYEYSSSLLWNVGVVEPHILLLTSSNFDEMKIENVSFYNSFYTVRLTGKGHVSKTVLYQ